MSNMNELKRRLEDCESKQFSTYFKKVIAKIKALMKKKSSKDTARYYTPTQSPSNSKRFTLVGNPYTPPKTVKRSPERQNKPELIKMHELMVRLAQEGFKKPKLVAPKMIKSGRPSQHYSKTTGMLKKGL